jgi:hypothetical protein
MFAAVQSGKCGWLATDLKHLGYTHIRHALRRDLAIPCLEIERT